MGDLVDDLWRSYYYSEPKSTYALVAGSGLLLAVLLGGRLHVVGLAVGLLTGVIVGVGHRIGGHSFGQGDLPELWKALGLVGFTLAYLTVTTWFWADAVGRAWHVELGSLASMLVAGPVGHAVVYYAGRIDR